MAELARRLTLRQAVMIGLGSMIGAGLFSAFGPAAAAVDSGVGLLLALVVAAVVATANATASAQLAAEYPTSGGTYAYGRERLGPSWGYLAGWGFVVGKTASCAAMALTFAAYASPDGWQRPVAALAVVVLVAVNCAGVTRTAAAATVIVVAVLLLLTVWAVALLTGGDLDARAVVSADGGLFDGVLPAAGLLFFAFAGYARIATLGEEVRDPERAIPRAVGLALGGAVAVYALVAVLLVASLGVEGIAASPTPLAAAVSSDPVGIVVRVAAALASLGALLALVAGIGRTCLAMAREGDVPRSFAAVHPRFRVPHRAELTVGVVVVVAVLTVDLRGAIGFSSFGVLVYYAIANAAAWTQTRRRYPRWFQVVGLVGCAVLAGTLPWQSVLVGLAALVIGLLVRVVRGPGRPLDHREGP